jgi:large subunit ribosomal protein L15
MKLHTLAPNKGAKHRVKRLGCGESSGHGKTSCKGNKGQKARSGSGTRVGFEGGQMPLHRRLPKRGFNNVNFKTKVEVVNLAQIEKAFNDGDTVDGEALRKAGLINRACDQIKVLGQGEITKKVNLVVDTISASAKDKVEKAGGSVTIAAEA